jgi:3-dehydroquinate synthase
MLDMTGFAASLVHRGIRLIRVPTTVLSQNDGGVGVKNGMDEHGQKNYVGTFAPPFAVLTDFNFLRTLPDKYWIGGLAEAFKVALIKDPDLFEYLRSNAARLNKRDEQAIEQVVKRTAILHLDHIRSGGDPFEFGTARPLDFGHWAGHRIETLSHYEIGHGQAVGIGIALDSCYAARKGLLTEEERDAILEALKAVGLQIWNDLLEKKTSGNDELEILAGLDEFREHLGGRLTITLPDHIGRKTEVHEMNRVIIRECLSYLKKISHREEIQSS